MEIHPWRLRTRRGDRLVALVSLSSRLIINSARTETASFGLAMTMNDLTVIEKGDRRVAPTMHHALLWHLLMKLFLGTTI